MLCLLLRDNIKNQLSAHVFITCGRSERVRPYERVSISEARLPMPTFRLMDARPVTPSYAVVAGG